MSKGSRAMPKRIKIGKKELLNMTTVILAEKPSQARSYVEAFKNSTKKEGYFSVSDPVLANETFITYGFGHLVELATPEKYDQKYKRWSLSNLPISPDKYKFIVNISQSSFTFL